MKEQLYTIPVNDAFAQDTECPICAMKESLRKNAVEFTLGPSYMEDDVRMETNRTGFCEEHVKQLYEEQNRLGIALMLLTHMDEVLKNIGSLQKTGRTAKTGLFKKSNAVDGMDGYLGELKKSCYICNKIEETMKYYIMTIFHLYRHDEAFKGILSASKGFCVDHYGLLYRKAPEYLNGKQLDEFTLLIDRIFMDNLKRVRDDLEWYTDKFDYRNADAPWKNSKDAVQRAIQKMNSIPEIK